MQALHLFNPGHETAVMLGNATYTPPANVRTMQHDLALLPLWYAKEGDFVWCEYPANEFIAFLPEGFKPLGKQLYALTASPSIVNEKLYAALWGISQPALRYFNEIRNKVLPQLRVQPWKSEYRELTGRETAAECLVQIKEKLPNKRLPDPPFFCNNINDILSFMEYNVAPFVLKTPYSSSGRGLLWVENSTLTQAEKNWITGAIQKQGIISIEQGLEKVRDFAMEFFIEEDGEVIYKGLSLFETGEKGAYTGNILAKQEDLEKVIIEDIGQSSFDEIRNIIIKVVSNIYGAIYTGYLGVDMMIYRDVDQTLQVHPCVEINMRYTMGMVAVRLFEEYVCPEASGNFIVCYDSEAEDMHKAMQAKFPPVIEQGRLKKGYISLCPVTADTRYRAFVFIP